MPELYWRGLADGKFAAFGHGRVCGIRTGLDKQATAEGIALAKQRGAYRGRKKALTDDQVVELRRRAAGEAKATLAREFGISRETLYQYLKIEPEA